MESSDIPTSDITQATQQSLESLGVRDAAALETLFARLERQLRSDVATVSGSGDGEKLEALRVRWLGRKQGIVRGISDNWLRSASPDLKRVIGAKLNALREMAEQQIESVAVSSTAPTTPAVRPKATTAEVRTVARDALDITLPGNRRAIGVRHPLRRVMDELTEIFFAIGYSVKEGPEIESTYYNFEALNIPEDHPSRDDQDTFYIDSKTVLRTHTSPVQIRTMEKQQPPVRIIVPGKVYRHDAPDATHSPIFHQLEGLAVDTNITFADLKGTLDYFLKAFFGPQVRTRLHPSFFPFTEPSAEVDMSCLFCGTGVAGCRVCKGSGWIELGGCGMVDPAVYSYVKYDASHFSGFAFGMGVERLAMLKYGVQDIQLFFQGDVRFLRQFR
jgi:phenylalanyl-tRNA synthetase alpha chain